jgi:hypothetical protein
MNKDADRPRRHHTQPPVAMKLLRFVAAFVAIACFVSFANQQRSEDVLILESLASSPVDSALCKLVDLGVEIVKPEDMVSLKCLVE